MRKIIQVSLTIVVFNYVLLTVLSFVFTSNFELDFIGKWGLLSGFLLLIGALPFFKVAYFGGRGIMGVQTPEIPPDEHLHHKVHSQHEKENEKEIEKNRKYQDMLTIAGITIIVLSILMV
ncbi:hypothetical protein GH741_12725 [Aquibacillus halophilus]|uniref:DUF3899 domain-containing protein n=1 Tax=Aquibacillus halophilus TaxID=930132 RepID=A0A6A8DD85_9BACI|nr:hypothetical protein [Aquibacillus halophilus]MRH43544.1 hypothetical protein [Aquibacillus halophilus]